jgi:hypothetical protein
MIRVVHPGSRILTFYPSRIPDSGVKKYKYRRKGENAWASKDFRKSYQNGAGRRCEKEESVRVYLGGGGGGTMKLLLCDGGGALYSVPVLWIRIWSDPHHFTGFGSACNSDRIRISINSKHMSFLLFSWNFNMLSKLLTILIHLLLMRKEKHC